MNIKDFVNSLIQDPNHLGLLLIMFGALLCFVFATINIPLFFFDPGFQYQQISPNTIFSAIKTVMGFVLGWLAIKYRWHIKQFHETTNKYGNYVIIMGIAMVISSYIVPGILVVAGGLLVTYKK
ncbi:hypothetical protein [Nitrosopumilus ureiphilus]|uniref:Uncharacterized protein n=1 Tax=Nitrosopumilus ureiphilus TaxID=1470067 RepID=A0A7D5R254_9ARCH|nr:hypothetical protein [Nitrosopumilus ureiphilus]QLH07176.1 hypothetical protein C5F50_08870 [Nitrosopumilus ureiphilus]